MAGISIDIPNDLKKEMENFPNEDWSELVNITIRKRLMILKKFDEITNKSTLTASDAIEIGRKMNQDALKKYLARRAQ